MRVGACLRRVAAASVVASIGLFPLLAATPLTSLSVSAAGFSCSSGAATYAVRSGDGWFSIAERADVGVRSLLDANGATSDAELHPGDRLCLPDGATLTALCESATTVRDGEGWMALAQRADVSMSSVLEVNGADASQVLHPGESVCLPAGAAAGSSSSQADSVGGDYTIARGDSWYRIAERAGTTVRALLEVNGASADAPLYPGREISLPAGATQPSAPDEASSGSGWAELAARPTQGPCWYSDSWGHPRAGGRRHVGVDVFTVTGEYVYAVADGTLTLRKWAQPGNISGNAWRLTADDGTAYFYAHLSDFAPDLSVGSGVRAGQIIGWIGRTGNTTVDHLHFEIRPGGGSPVNPYPVLRAHGGACNQGTPYTQPGGWIPD